jgi:hypothetical protein
METTKQHRSHPIGLNRIRFHWNRELRTRCYYIEGGEPIWIECPPSFGGLGDVVAGAAKAVGVKPSPGCGCEKRREALNRATPKVVARLLDALRGYWSKW